MTEDPNAADRDLLLLDDDDIDLSEEEEIDMENIDLPFRKASALRIRSACT